MILVTGATGFIGSHLMCHLAEKNIFPVAMFRHESNKKRVLKLFQSKYIDAKERYNKITWRKGDFRDFPSLDSVFVGISHVYHCAGYISMAHRDVKKLLEINETIGHEQIHDRVGILHGQKQKTLNDGHFKNARIPKRRL